MAQATVKTSKSGEGAGKIFILLRPRNLDAGLKPEYVVEHFPATIGRHPVNDIELPFDSVSRYHARLELRDGQLQLADLRSSNGTFVNGKRVQLAPIVDHDVVTFGSLDFTVVFSSPEDEPSSPGARPAGEQDMTSVHFVNLDTQGQTIYHTELPEDSTHADVLQDDITNAATLRRAKHRLVTLYRLQDTLRSTTDEARLLQGVLDLLFDVLPVDRGVFLLRDEADPAVFRPVAIKLKSGITRERIGISRTILQRCLRDRIAVLTRNAGRDQRFSAAESIVAGQMCSVMCVPLINARQIFGFCHLDTTESVRSFTEEDLAFLAHVAQEVALHLHNLRMMQSKITSERMAAIGQTITGMAHNIKNILVLSQGGVEMMDKRLRDRNYDALEGTWAVVRRGVDRVNKLVQEMLDYSRARQVEKTRVNLQEFIPGLRESFAEEMARRGITCRLQLDERIPALMLDADGLEKALVNLVVNAMEACEDRAAGEITLRAALDDDTITLQVEDTAGGIPEEILPRIFVPFFTTKGAKGSGLGLAMTRKLVEDMGGHIDVKSTTGVGTCFTISLQVGPGAPRLEPSLVNETPEGGGDE